MQSKKVNIMTTIVKPSKDARFFSNMSNARRGVKKVFNCSTEVANSLIHMEAPEDGGRYWFSEAAVNRAANPAIEADKVTTIEVPAVATVSAPQKESKSRSEIRNGVRRPIKGKCADVWAALDEIKKQGFEIDISVVREVAAQRGWNLNNATIEFYGWRKFNAVEK